MCQAASGCTPLPSQLWSMSIRCVASTQLFVLTIFFEFGMAAAISESRESARLPRGRDCREGALPFRESSVVVKDSESCELEGSSSDFERLRATSRARSFVLELIGTRERLFCSERESPPLVAVCL